MSRAQPEVVLPRTVQDGKTAMGFCSTTTHKRDLAEGYAKKALAVAEKINGRVEIAACYRIFVQVEQPRSVEPTASGGVPRGSTASGGAPSKAREWYKKAIDLFSLRSSRCVIAVGQSHPTEP